MKGDMVANMEVDKVADMELDKVAVIWRCTWWPT